VAQSFFLLNSPLHRSRQPAFTIAHGDLAHVAGTPIAFAAEIDALPSNIDHFWVTILIGNHGSLRIALSTHSRQNAVAGFDPRIRVGLITSTWTDLPTPGIAASPGLDYSEIESKAKPAIIFNFYERPALEALLLEKCGRAIFIEAWGEFYFRKERGIHQVHSRRASCSVSKDEIGKDGAIRFYYGENTTSEMLLFKYCGQP
jgi:hypothetical protein